MLYKTPCNGRIQTRQKPKSPIPSEKRRMAHNPQIAATTNQPRVSLVQQQNLDCGGHCTQQPQEIALLHLLMTDIRLDTHTLTVVVTSTAITRMCGTSASIHWSVKNFQAPPYKAAVFHLRLYNPIQQELLSFELYP